MKIFRKLTLLLPGVLLCSGALFAQSTFSGGDGSEGNPYQIANEQDLRNLAKDVNDTHITYAGKYFLQTADITFNTQEAITPIGGGPSAGFSRSDDECFQGTYDGGSKKIYNLNLYDASELKGGETAHSGVGLFGDLGKGATVKNVIIASGHIYGDGDVGAIAGILHENTTVTRCKVGPDVRIFSYSVGGGIAGTSLGKNIYIRECANYANVSVSGLGMFKCAGGIIASSAETRIEACANFGDIWAKGGFAGGIIGYTPLSQNDFFFSYPEMRSCMNGGDITSMEPVSGGLIGAAAFNIQDYPGGAPNMIANSYSYGQTYVTFSNTNGPVVGMFLRTTPITVTKTYYNADRFFFKKQDDADSDIAFTYGEARTHEQIRSAEFLAELNATTYDGPTYLFEQDKHNMNGTMPVLAWINETYDAAIDKPNQYRKDIEFTKFVRPAGSLFMPNRQGDFLIYNMSMNEPDAQAKSMGCSKDRVWIDRVLAQKGGESYTFFMSSSGFRKPIAEDGMYVAQKPAQTADHWMITPAFYVNEDFSWFHWVAASEETDKFRCAYEVYVLPDENADSPKAFADATPLFTTDAEEPIKTLQEEFEGEQRAYYELTPRKIDLSQFAGKTVRVAFRDVSQDKFHLLIGKMRVAQENGVAPVTAATRTQVTVHEQTLSAQNATARLALYSLTGRLVAAAEHTLRYTAQPGMYLLVATDNSGRTETHKVIIR